MKKLLELLGTILITSNAAGTLAANKPNNNNDKIKNSLETLTRQKRQAPKKSVNKKDNPTKSSTTKPQNEQPDIIEKEINLDEDYADSIQNMLEELRKEKHLNPLRNINMGGLISNELDNKTIISKLEELEPKMVDWIKEQQNSKAKVLILTLKNNDNKSIKLVINLSNFYVQGFINQNQYFYFKDSQVKEIKDEDLNIQEPINLGYDSNYSHLIPTADLMISYQNIKDSIIKLSKYNKINNNSIKEHLARLVFITSEAMRFQCDEKSLEIFANIKNTNELKKIISENKNILKAVQKIIDNEYSQNSEDTEIKWSDYEKQIKNWDKYSKELNKFRIEIWKELIKMKKLNDFICQNKNKIIEIFKKENEEKKILNEIRELFNKEENEKFKELKDSNFLEQFTEIKFREMQIKLLKFFKDSTNDLANNFEGLNISEKEEKLTHFKKKLNEIKNEEINLSLNFENNGVFLFAVIKDNLDFLKFLLNSGIKIEIKNIEWLEKWAPLHFAVQNGNLEIVKMLINKAEELYKDKPKEFKKFINAINTDNFTPLHIAVAKKHNQEIVKLLIEKGADINAQTSEDTDKVTPLHIAVKDGSLIIVELLLQQGAEADSKNQDDATPLHLAAKKKRKKIVELLIKKAKEIYQEQSEEFKKFINARKSNNGKTPLHFAIEEREDAIVELLLKNGADVNAGKSNNGKTPLHFAAEYSFTNKVIKLLIKKAKEIYQEQPEEFKNFINAQTSNKKKTALHYTVQYGHTDIVQELLNQENIEINVKNEDEGNTALHIAAQNGHLAIVKLLIKKAKEIYQEQLEEFKKFINAINEKGDTPLKLAEEKNYTETVELLLKNGAVSEIQDNDNTLMEWQDSNQEEYQPPNKKIKHNKNEENKQTEEKNGLDINKIKNQDEATALHMAVKDGNEELVKFLINELDVDVNARKSNNGKTPLHFAIEEREDAIVELLLKNGADVNAGKSNNGKTPLHFAAQYSYTNKVVKLLLNNGADVAKIHNDKWTALHYAVQYGHTDIVQELLTNEKSKNQININFKNKKGNTALHIAAQNGHLAIVKLLIKKAKEIYQEQPEPEEFKKFINAINEKGNTPLALAEEKNHTETVKFLLDHGAVKKIQDNDDTTMDWQDIHDNYGGAGPNGNGDATNQGTGGSPRQHHGGDRIVGEQAGTSGTQNQNTSGTNQNNRYDVPADGSCLFWSVATAYLLPARSNDEAFRNRFIQLFGELQLSYLSYVQNLFQQFDVENNTNTQTWYQDATAHRLVRIVFRNRVVDYIQSNLDTIPNRDGELTFRSLIQDNNEIDTNYLERMRQPSTWGGTPEIIAMSNLLNANISVGTDGPYQPVHQNANDNNIAISYVELEKGSGIHNHYNLDLTPEEERTNQSIVINDNQGNVSGVDITKRPDNLLPTTPKPEANAIKLAVDDHGQHHAIPANNNEDDDANQGNNIAKAPEPTTTPLQKDEYHFVDKKTEEKSLKNDENLEINLIKNNNKIKQNVPVVNKPINKNIINAQITATKAINQYNALSKEEKLKRLNEINRYYQTLSENDKKTFKEKLTNTGLASLSGGALTAYGTKMTVSSTAATSVTNAEAMEMTSLLSTSTTESLAAAETITVAETAAVEGGIIAGETGTAAALAPETLGLSLVIGGLAIAGTWMYFAFHHHSTSDIALPASIHHNVYDNIEKWYKFLAHDKLKIKINKNTWNEIKQNKNSQATITKIIKNKFIVNDHSGWGGSVTNEDFNTLVKVILLHFEQINGYFEILDNENDGFVIITNTEGDWLGIE